MERKRIKNPLIWAFSTYLAEGFPYSIIRTVSGLFFRDMKVSLESIGLTPLFGLPWIFKFLWAPQVDKYETKRRWMLVSQAAFTIILFFTGFFAPIENGVSYIAIFFFLGAITSATNDIAIDGYYMEALDSDGQSKFVGYRVMAYRVAWMSGPGIIATVGTTIGWSYAFFLADFIYLLIFLFHLTLLAEVQKRGESFLNLLKNSFKPKIFLILIFAGFSAVSLRLFFNSQFYDELKARVPILKKIGFSHLVAIILLIGLIILGLSRKKLGRIIKAKGGTEYGKAFLSFMERDRISTILSFLILLRAGEWALTVMVAPMIVDIGIKQHYGWISGGVGLPASIVGAMLGGWMISKFTLKKMIWPFILLQNLTNIVYMLLAIHLDKFIKLNTGSADPVGIGTFNIILTASVHAFDQFAGGLGTAVLMTYLMRICAKEFKATHYAIGTGLMNLSGLFAGVLSGFIAGWLGYAWLFGISFIFSVPAMLFIPRLPYLENKN